MAKISVNAEVVAARSGETDLDTRIDNSFVILQSELKLVSARATTTSSFPADDSTPQIGEGVDISGLGTTITPTISTSRIRVTGSVVTGGTGGGQVNLVALFKDGAAPAVRTSVQRYNNNQEVKPHVFAFEFSPGSTSAITFAVRYGISTSGTALLNDWNAADRYNSTYSSWVRYEEIA